jgi:hypothetical protein
VVLIVHRARLADIRFSATCGFKANRKRRLNTLIASNVSQLMEDQQRMAAHVVDTTRVEDLFHSSASADFFSCTLTLNSWVDMLFDKDVCGFGLAVSRPEWVIDDPTQIRVSSISSTFFSKSAIEDAIEMSIDLRGHMGSTGGFGIGGELGVAIRGRGREPINTWLPLYVHAEHWAVVRIVLRQILGYYVALDPLAFRVNQIDAMFLVLGTMVSRLQHPVGEHQLHHLFQFMRTCYQVAVEFHWLPEIEKALSDFIALHLYDTQHQPNNLIVIASYLLVLPRDSIQRIMEASPTAWCKFWISLLSTSVRRSAFSILAHTDADHVMGVVDRILYGTLYSDPSVAEQLLSEPQQQDMMRGAAAVPPLDSIVVDQATPHSDAAPSTTSGKHCNYYRPKLAVARNQEDDTSNAGDHSQSPPPLSSSSSAKTVGEYRAGDDLFTDCFFVLPTGDSDSDSEPILPSAYATERVTPSMLDMLSRFSTQIERRGYPTLRAIHSLLVFCTAWRDIMPATCDEFCAAIDELGGLAPQAYVAGIKAAYQHAATPTRTSPLGTPDEQPTDDAPSSSIVFHVNDVLQLLPLEQQLPHSNATVLARAIVAQGIMYRTNTAAKQAMANQLYMDSVADAQRCLLAVHSQLHAIRHDNAITLWQANRFMNAMRSTIGAVDMNVFINDVRYKLQGTRYRHALFPQFIRQFQRPKSLQIPNLELKLKIVLGGKYVTWQASRLQVEEVLDHGQVWIPGRRHLFYFCKALGTALIEHAIQLVQQESLIIAKQQGLDLQ